MTRKSGGSAGSPSVTYSMSIPLAWAVGTSDSLRCGFSCFLPGRPNRCPLLSTWRERRRTREAGATKPWAGFEADEDDLDGGHAQDEARKAHNLEGPGR